MKALDKYHREQVGYCKDLGLYLEQGRWHCLKQRETWTDVHCEGIDTGFYVLKYLPQQRQGDQDRGCCNNLDRNGGLDQVVTMSMVVERSYEVLDVFQR
jgi:hypothetical protein